MKNVYVKYELQSTKEMGECIILGTKKLAYLLETGELAETSGEKTL